MKCNNGWIVQYSDMMSGTEVFETFDGAAAAVREHFTGGDIGCVVKSVEN